MHDVAPIEPCDLLYVDPLDVDVRERIACIVAEVGGQQRPQAHPGRLRQGVQQLEDDQLRTGDVRTQDPGVDCH